MLKYNILIIILLWSLASSGQEVLTLDSCRNKALDHSQSVKAAEADFSTSVLSQKLSKRGMLPQFDFSATYTYMNDPQIMDIPGFELPTLTGAASGIYYPGGVTNLTYHNNYSGGVDLSLPIYLGGKLRNYVKMSEIGLGIAEHNLTNTKENLVLQVDQQYWSLVSLKENLLVVQKSVSLLEDVVKQTENWQKVGIVTSNEVLKAKVELNNARLAVIKLNDNVTLARMALNQIIGYSVLTEVEVADSVVVEDSKPVTLNDISQLAEQRHELQMLEKQVEISEVNRKVTRSDYMPQLVTFANYGFQNPNHKAEDVTELTWVAGVNLSIPVFHWGERNLKLEMQELATQKAQLTYDNVKEGMILDIQQSAFQVNESLLRISFTKESLAQADENLTLEMNRLKQGVITATDVLDAQVQWQKAYADFIDAKVGFKISESNYQKVIGNLSYE